MSVESNWIVGFTLAHENAMREIAGRVSKVVHVGRNASSVRARKIGALGNHVKTHVGRC